MKIWQPVTTTPRIRLVEVFSSIQGEGILVGRRQVFVRTYGCNIRCSYCDSPETLKETPSPAVCRIESPPGSWQFEREPNPVSAARLTAVVGDYLSEPHHSLSITGGEPLLHAQFLAHWLPQIRAATDLKVFLETNGLLPEHLARIVHLLDYVSMDFKAPTATGLTEEQTWGRHVEFLRIARACVVYGKLVLTPTTTDEEVFRTAETLALVDRSIPLILQPVTPFGRETAPIRPGDALRHQAIAARILTDVRVIPQTHKMMQMI